MWLWDVLFSIGQFAVTCILAIWGLKLDKWQHKTVIGLVVLLGALLTGATVYRSVVASKALTVGISGLTTAIKHTHLRFSIEGVAIDETIPFTENKKIRFNVYYGDNGTPTAHNVRAYGRVVLVTIKPDLDLLFRDLRTLNWTRPDEELVYQAWNFTTAEGRELNKEDVKNIKNGKMGVLVVALAKFADDTGKYDQEFCSFLQTPGTVPIWHPCASHNQEIPTSALQ